MLKRTIRAVLFAAAFGVIWTAAARAYIGDSFISIPGVTGHWPGKDHKDWIRIEAHEWPDMRMMMGRLISGPGDPLAGDKLWFGGPSAVPPGKSGRLIVTLGKSNPDRAQMQNLCATKTPTPEMTYAESSDRARPVLELGARPAEFPAWWEYKLKEVVVSACPLVEEAAEQAFILSFKDIEWLNYDANRPNANKLVVGPEDLPDVKPAAPAAGKKVKSFLVTWIAIATDAAEDQCPVMNTKPTEERVYRYWSKEDVAAARAKAGERGLGNSEQRGPNRLNTVSLPGIVPDPGLHEPTSPYALGIDLDGDDGSGPPPPGIRKHGNFVSPDGRKGIDNQYHRVMGCAPGFRGKKGYSNQTPNARRADGNITTIVEISGIDDEKNDDSVEVALIHSMDKPIRDTNGSKFIPNYTFRPTSDPNFALYNRRMRGRIVNGVVETERVSDWKLTQGQGAPFHMFDAKLRIEITPDGAMRAYWAGYQDWKSAVKGSGYSEGLFNFQTEALYYAMKRHADGLFNPVTGEYNGISTVYEIDGVPAFMTPAPPKTTSTSPVEKTASR